MKKTIKMKKKAEEDCSWVLDRIPTESGGRSWIVSKVISSDKFGLIAWSIVVADTSATEGQEGTQTHKTL